MMMFHFIAMIRMGIVMSLNVSISDKFSLIVGCWTVENVIKVWKDRQIDLWWIEIKDDFFAEIPFCECFQGLMRRELTANCALLFRVRHSKIIMNNYCISCTCMTSIFNCISWKTMLASMSESHQCGNLLLNKTETNKKPKERRNPLWAIVGNSSWHNSYSLLDETKILRIQLSALHAFLQGFDFFFSLFPFPFSVTFYTSLELAAPFFCWRCCCSTFVFHFICFRERPYICFLCIETKKKYKKKTKIVSSNNQQQWNNQMKKRVQNVANENGQNMQTGECLRDAESEMKEISNALQMTVKTHAFAHAQTFQSKAKICT